MEEILELIKKAQAHDNEAMETLIRMFNPKVVAIAREYFLLGAETSDLIQEGMIGLYKAIQVYDSQKNNNFGAFASFCIHRQLQNAVKNANRMKNNPLNTYLPINNYDGSSTSDDEDILKLVVIDDESDIEQNFIEKELNSIAISKVKEILSEEQFKLLKMFLNGAKYEEMAKKLDITTKDVDNKLQAIKKKLRTIEGELK